MRSRSVWSMVSDVACLVGLALGAMGCASAARTASPGPPGSAGLESRSVEQTSFTVVDSAEPFDALTSDDKSRAIEAATSSASVLALLDGQQVTAQQVSPSGATRWVQVYLALTNGRAVLTGAWPHVVIENPAACETCKPDGPLRYHFETETGSREVRGILVNVDPNSWEVREIYSDPAPNAPIPPPSTGAS